MKIYKNEDRNWCFDFTCNGIRVRKIVGLSKQETEQVMWDEHKKIKREGYGIREARKNLLFEAFADEFLELHSKQKKRSWKSDETSLAHLKKYFGGKFLSSITPEMIERYRADRKEMNIKGDKKRRKISPATVNREITCLKTLFGKAVKWNKIEANPAAEIQKDRERNTKERILSDKEARQLIAAAAFHLKPILITALSTGMRRNEILRLKWENVHVPERYIFIEDSKSGKTRCVPINSQIIEALSPLPHSSEYVFVNPDTKSFFTDIKTGFKAACRRAGIKGVRLHDLRHTAASIMVREGVDLVTVSKILGHSSIQMTMRYAHPTPEAMKKAVEIMGGILEKKAAVPEKEPEKTPETAGKNPVNARPCQFASGSQLIN